jgi:hypothetical protein
MRRRQPLATFGAASLQDQSAVFGRHAGAEAVSFGAASIVWLECALWHSEYFLLQRKQ